VNSLHILVIEADDAVGKVVAAMLEDGGNQVTTVISAAATEEWLQSEARIDGILLGAGLPGESTRTVIAQLGTRGSQRDEAR
jgi:CheY-like chemotaxis protein